MARKATSTEDREPTMLKVQREEASTKILDRIDRGNNFLALEIGGSADYERIRKEYLKWDFFNKELLGVLFSTDKYAKTYSASTSMMVRMYSSFSDDVNELRDNIGIKIRRLESIVEILEIVSVEKDTIILSDSSSAPVKSLGKNNKIFIVHGHDNEARESVARLLEKLSFEVIILHEQPNSGKTIIEKFLKNSDVGFVVVLLTPDDIGAKQDGKDSLKPRARQNVIFELGYFIGHLGRHKVAALVKGEVETPSDFYGVVYTKMDAGGAWRFQLCQELKAAAFDVDFNKIL